jgi:hypothetical protein
MSAGDQGYLSSICRRKYSISLLHLLVNGNIVIAREKTGDETTVFYAGSPATSDHLSRREKRKSSYWSGKGRQTAR